MAMDLEVIRRILIEAKTAGVEATTAQLKGLSAGYEGVTVASEKTESATESITRKFQQMESRLDPAARSARNLAKDIATLDAALAQDAGLAQRHAELLTLATNNALKMSGAVTEASASQKLWGQATSAVNTSMQTLAAGAGPVGFALTSIGGAGLAVGVALGVAVKAFQSFSDAAHSIATKSEELKRFADTTGFTTDQVQLLGKQAKNFGLAGDDIQTGLQRFAAGFEELREGGGSLLASIQRVDAGLAAQMQTSETSAQALIQLQQALRATDNVFEQSRIARAALGRGGVAMVDFIKNADFSKLDADIGTLGYGLDKNIIEKTRKIGHEIEEVDKKIQHAFGADFAPFFLSLELGWKGYELTVLQGLARIKQGFEGSFTPPDTAQKKFVAGTEAGVPAKLLNEQQRLTTLMQDQLAIAERIRKEEGFDNPAAERSEAIAKRLREQLEAVDAQIKKIRGDTEEPIELKFQLPKIDLKQVQNAVYGSVDIGSPKAGLIGPTLDVGTTGTIEAQTAAYKKQHEALGALTPVQDTVLNKMRELMIAQQNGVEITDEQSNALRALARAQAELARVPEGQYLRMRDEINQLMAAYPGLTAAEAKSTAQFKASIETLHARTAAEREHAAASTARASGAGTGNAELEAARAVTTEIQKQEQAHRDAMNAMQGQLAVAQAVTGIEKINAQAAATYAQLIDQGRTAEQASAEASKQKQVAIAQVNSAAQAQLMTLRDQYSVSAAVTGAEKMHASAANTTTALLRQGVDAYTAQAVGAQELANAQAAATASVENSITGLQQQLEVLQASTQAEKDRVLARQAYDNAVASGADPEAARQLQAATEAVSSEKRRQAEENEKLKAQERERVAICKEQVRAEQEYENELAKIFDLTMKTASASKSGSMGFSVGAPGAEGSSTTERINTGIPWGPWVHSRTPYVPQTAESFADDIARLKARGFTSAHVVGSDPNMYIVNGPLDQDFLTQQGQQPYEMSRVRAQIAGDKPAEIAAVQGQLAYMKTRPESLENLNAIKSLMDALKQLTTATEDNTQASDALSGLYSRQFGQGFYDGGAAVGELIYGLDNNTGSAIDDMQHAANDNSRNQNDLLTNLSQNQVQSYAFYSGGIIGATNNVQSELQSGFSSLTYAVQHPTPTATLYGNPTLAQQQAEAYGHPTPTATLYGYPGLDHPTPTATLYGYPGLAQQQAEAWGHPTPTATLYGYPGLAQQQAEAWGQPTPTATLYGNMGFARGGSFTTAGYGGDDSNVVAFRVSPQRERVSIVPVNGGNGGGSGNTNNISNNISINVPQGTNEFRSSAMHVADEIFNQIAVAGRRR